MINLTDKRLLLTNSSSVLEGTREPNNVISRRNSDVKFSKGSPMTSRRSDRYTNPNNATQSFTNGDGNRLLSTGHLAVSETKTVQEILQQ